MINKIRNEAQYDQIMTLIESYIKKSTEGGGFHTLSNIESEELASLSSLAEQYEDNILKIMPLPLTITSVVKHKAKEMNITQAKLADILGIGSSKLSQILSGKRDPDIPYLKAIHTKLGISGDFLLESV